MATKSNTSERGGANAANSKGEDGQGTILATERSGLSFLDGLRADEDEATDEFTLKYPLIAAALRKWSPSEDHANPTLRVVAKSHGFRRGGIAHSSQPTEHTLVGMNPDQVEAILADPDLVAEIV